MEKEFVPYELAVKLKELGFDEECLAYYYKHGNSKKEKLFYYPSQDEYDIDDHPYLEPNSKTNSDAPLWQQVFDWFRVTHQLSGEVYKQYPHANKYYDWCYAIHLSYDRGHDVEGYKTYEEARLECLRKLIEIVENNKQ